jgi:uncharacterized protein DUF5670
MTLAKAGGSRRATQLGGVMLYTIAVILLILWLLGFFAFHVGGGLIHLLLVIAIIVIVVRLVQGRRPIP